MFCFSLWFSLPLLLAFRGSLLSSVFLYTCHVFLASDLSYSYDVFSGIWSSHPSSGTTVVWWPPCPSFHFNPFESFNLKCISYVPPGITTQGNHVKKKPARLCPQSHWTYHRTPGKGLTFLLESLSFPSLLTEFSTCLESKCDQSQINFKQRLEN